MRSQLHAYNEDDAPPAESLLDTQVEPLKHAPTANMAQSTANFMNSWKTTPGLSTNFVSFCLLKV